MLYDHTILQTKFFISRTYFENDGSKNATVYRELFVRVLFWDRHEHGSKMVFFFVVMKINYSKTIKFEVYRIIE